MRRKSPCSLITMGQFWRPSRNRCSNPPSADSMTSKRVGEEIAGHPPHVAEPTKQEGRVQELPGAGEPIHPSQADDRDAILHRDAVRTGRQDGHVVPTTRELLGKVRDVLTETSALSAAWSRARSRSRSSTGGSARHPRRPTRRHARAAGPAHPHEEGEISVQHRHRVPVRLRSTRAAGSGARDASTRCITSRNSWGAGELAGDARHHQVLAALDLPIDDDRQAGGHAFPHGGGARGPVARIHGDPRGPEQLDDVALAQSLVVMRVPVRSSRDPSTG